MREVSLERNTNETQIELTLNLDGAGRYQVDTGCGFLNHMLELFARHGRFDLVLTCHGDVEVLGPRREELPRLCAGILAVDGHAVVVALRQPDDLAAPQVNGRK